MGWDGIEAEIGADDGLAPCQRGGVFVAHFFAGPPAYQLAVVRTLNVLLVNHRA